MYRTLKAEMVRADISIKQLEIQIGITERSLRNKINGKTEFLWSETLKIRKIVSPGMTLEELFKSETNAA